jgi:ribonucleotide monophosphatase NagD (HAD superfamily)
LGDVCLSKFLMVGDNLSTDILFGNKCEIDTLLVLSGVTNAGKAERVLEEANKGRFSRREGELEGVPTHVMSLLSQSGTIDFDQY